LKLKFPSFHSEEIGEYLKIFFFEILAQFIISSDYSTLATKTIISQETKSNFIKIFSIWKQFIYGNFYMNDNDEYCDFTPFNWFFIDVLKEMIGGDEKLIDVNIPQYLLRTSIKETNNFVKAKEEMKNENKNFYLYSSSFTVDNLITIVNEVSKNMDNFLDGGELSYPSTEFKDIFKKMKDNINILQTFKQKDNPQNINFYIYYEIFHFLEMKKNKKSDYFQIEETNDDDNKIEEIDSFINIHNWIYELLYNSEIAFSSNIQTHNLDNFLQILQEIYNFNKIKFNFLSQNLIDEDFNDIDAISDFKNRIHSLSDNLRNLDEKYSKNNYSLLFESLNEKVENSIQKYNFGLLSPIIDGLEVIKNNTNIFLLNQEKYTNSRINSKLRNFIENQSIEVEMAFKFSGEKKYFKIIKKEKNMKFPSDFFSIKKAKIITCHNIPDFIRKFPYFTKIQMKKEIDLLDLQKKIDIKNALFDYFDIIKEFICSNFPPNEVKYVSNKIKRRILIKLYNKIFPRESDSDDLTFHYQCLCLSWVELKHLSKTDTYNNNFVSITTNLFNKLNVEKSFEGKNEIIQKIFETFNNILRINKGDNYSTDDIAPLCEYALIKARPERLSSNLKFIETLMPENSSNLDKMHFDYLKNSMYIIKNINYKHFYGITEEEFNKKCLQAKNKSFDFN
jgi:hypothetical protein